MSPRSRYAQRIAKRKEPLWKTLPPAFIKPWIMNCFYSLPTTSQAVLDPKEPVIFPIRKGQPQSSPTSMCKWPFSGFLLFVLGILNTGTMSSGERGCWLSRLLFFPNVAQTYSSYHNDETYFWPRSPFLAFKEITQRESLEHKC